MEFAHQKLWQLVKSWIGTSEKLPRLSPIGNQLEKEPCPTRPNSVAEQPLYTAPMIGFVVSQGNGFHISHRNYIEYMTNTKLLLKHCQ